MKKKLFLILCLLLFVSNILWVETWSFVAYADTRSAFESYRYVLKQIWNMNNLNSNNTLVDFIVACGDMDPVSKNDMIYKEIFPDEKPLYFPVIGNHEHEPAKERNYVLNVLLPRISNVARVYDKKSANYYFDWKNVRFIVLDQYSKLGIGGDKGWVSIKGCAWIEETILSALDVDHIFIALHEPVFPRHRHLRKSGLSEEEINCWSMLVSYSDKVRAVFTGHTHNYYRMRVRNAQKVQASLTSYPDEEGGIYQIDTGNAGNKYGGDGKLTMVQVVIDGPDVIFKTFQSPTNKKDFKVTDNWQIKGKDISQPTKVAPGFCWKKTDGKNTYKPGQVIQCSLWAYSFSNMQEKGYKLNWQIIGSEGFVIKEDNIEFNIAPREKKEILCLDIQTDQAIIGTSWELEASLFLEDKEVQSWEKTFLFPSYKNLAGTWLIKKGDDSSWAKKRYKDSEWLQIDVPSAWEKSVLPNYNGIAWYRVHFNISKECLKLWGSRPLAVVIGAIDDADETYLNGKKIGQSGRFPPKKKTAWEKLRIYKFDSKLLKGNNVIAVRVSDWGGDGGIWRAPVAIGPVDELKKMIKLLR
ncbi:MAG: metallophosphoesterase [Spirochaetes bacterium]|nr:metallophosphoesterase [Spirochaetota bacterium]